MLFIEAYFMKSLLKCSIISLITSNLHRMVSMIMGKMLLLKLSIGRIADIAGKAYFMLSLTLNLYLKDFNSD